MFVNDPALDLFLRGLILTATAMVWVVLLTRINGLRSFSKMTNFDFVMTVAVGSLLAGASQATGWKGFMQALVAMVGLFLVQYTAARMRKSSSTFETLVQNRPLLLMRDGAFIEEALFATRVTESDLIAKLRESNVLELSKVRAVILETTGDISVMHGDTLEEDLLLGTKTIGD
ncbi:DUF421 domain-containing protein [Mariniblastus fucicola]|uniref:YetF C-terminal domain-containing protein n=1 Tax=Mariniblastus fucicola TaxID=980251 RepID=A0A5B9PF70_9BACT|nr:YetF domain-containing protein [Mariniblastus fucicola]QEG24904.1 hypothetical protein MFFC18_48270 [Mariniblastus fucicola]